MSGTNRYFTNSELRNTEIDAHQELLDSLDRINTYNPPVQTCSTGWKFGGLYTGPTSVAYLFYRLYSVYPEVTFKDQSFLDWAQAYLDLSTHVRKHDPDPDHCGIANETLAHATLQAVIQQDASLVEKVCSYRHIINNKSKSGSNEWLYGRAGYLYFLRLARSVFTAETHASTSKLLTTTIEQTVERILEEPQPWLWHGSHYLGAAHGIIGIVCQVILAMPATASRLQYLLSYVLDQQYPSGNFPSSLPTGTDELVQFCHGGPGFVFSLETILPHFSTLESNIETAISKAQADIWTRGLLRKVPSLCHGIAGNALVLESYESMQHFLSYMTTAQLEASDWMDEAGHSPEFPGLYTGEAGRAWAWAVLDKRLPRTCIGYNDL